tara:strand:+ start:190 stop:483 length:294 start_codon:yes stop_codon:yes gene_type:complete
LAKKKISKIKKVLGNKPASGQTTPPGKKKKKLKAKSIPKAVAEKENPVPAAGWREGDATPEHQASSAQKALREVADEELERTARRAPRVDHQQVERG